jgi:ADP-heptose:LPS heptosyltransferase
VSQQRILVIKLGALGDLILSTEAFQAIRAAHPKAHLTLLTRRPFVSLAKSMPWFDAVLEDPNPKLIQVSRWLTWRRVLRAGGFSRVYDLQINDRSNFYFWLLGPNRPEWCGTARGCSHRRHDHRRDPVQAAERLLLFLESVGVPRQGPPQTDWLTGDLADLGLPPRYVVLVPGCAPQHPHKRWPAAAFAAVANHLAKQKIPCVSVGTAVDEAAIAEIRHAAPHVISLAGKTSIGQLAEVARNAVATIGNDTGPVHIAAITGCPTLVLMSEKTDPVRMLPRGRQVSWLRRDVLAELTPDEVIAEIPS